MFSTQSLPVENILLHQAAYNGNINEVRLLLNVKTDINIKDKKDLQPCILLFIQDI